MSSFMLLVLIGTALAFLASLWALVNPDAAMARARSWLASARARQGIALFRIVFGIALVLAAPESRQPLVFQVLGGHSFIKALSILLVPTDTAIARLDKFATKPLRVRALILVGIGVCVYIVYLTPVMAGLT